MGGAVATDPVDARRRTDVAYRLRVNDLWTLKTVSYTSAFPQPIHLPHLARTQRVYFRSRRQLGRWAAALRLRRAALWCR